MTPEHPFEQVRETLLAVAASNPDYVNNPSVGRRDCRYANADGSPSCIVGHVLVALGEPLPDFGSDDNGRFVNRVVNREAFSPESIALLQCAQSAQDQPGKTWAEAVEGL